MKNLVTCSTIGPLNVDPAERLGPCRYMVSNVGEANSSSRADRQRAFLPLETLGHEEVSVVVVAWSRCFRSRRSEVRGGEGDNVTTRRRCRVSQSVPVAPTAATAAIAARIAKSRLRWMSVSRAWNEIASAVDVVDAAVARSHGVTASSQMTQAWLPG